MSLRKRIESFGHAFRGVGDLFRSQPNARIHALATLIVVVAGFYWQISRLEWIASIGCIVLVLSLEAVNTALEYLTDLVSPNYHPLAGKAKDAAAAAVLIAATGAIIIGAIIFLPKILSLFY